MPINYSTIDRDVAKIFACVNFTSVTREADGGLLHDAKLHMSNCFCSNQTSTSNKLPASIARLIAAWMLDTHLDPECPKNKLKSTIALDHVGVQCIPNDCELALRKTVISVNYSTTSETSQTGSRVGPTGLMKS